MDAEILIDTYRDIIVEAVLKGLLIAFKISAYMLIKVRPPGRN